MIIVFYLYILLYVVVVETLREEGTDSYRHVELGELVRFEHIVSQVRKPQFFQYTFRQLLTHFSSVISMGKSYQIMRG